LASGLGVLFGKLQQGVAENQQMLTIARMRAEAEDVYGMRLGEIGSATDRITGGFSRDDGASVRKVRDPIPSKRNNQLIFHRHMMEFEQKWKRPPRIIEKSHKASEIWSWLHLQDGVMRMNRGFRIPRTIFKHA
jgi:hypothetical protein